MSTDKLPIPLGENEGQALEFKSRDALDSHERIGREVVAMLNAGGTGEIWIGVGEEGGVAIALEPIESVDDVIRRLRDHLVDTIEPPLLPGEMKVTAVPIEKDKAVIRVRIQPRKGRGPFALFRRGMRLFVVRIGDRLRTMTRDEIVDRLGAGRHSVSTRAAEQEALAEVFRSLTGELDALRTEPKAHNGFFWLCVQPVESGELDLQKLARSDYLTDPTLSGNRVAGLNFAAASHYGGLEPEIEKRVLRLGQEDILSLRVSRNGGLRFEAPLTTFYRPLPLAEFRDRLIFYPLALVEYPTSVLRLAAALYADADLWEQDGQPRPDAEVVVHLAMLGLKGWFLAPGSPEQAWQRRGLAKPYDQTDFELDRPLVVTAHELTDGGADRTAFRVLREVYEAFDFAETDLPREFDPVTRQLALSE